MDRSKLQKSGKNGFLLIMLVLVWWGVALNRDGEWSRAVADVKDILQCKAEHECGLPVALYRYTHGKTCGYGNSWV